MQQQQQDLMGLISLVNQSLTDLNKSLQSLQSDKQTMYGQLSQLISLWEASENLVTDYLIEKYREFVEVWTKILKNYPLNDRKLDIVHELRKDAMVLHSLLFDIAIQQDKQSIKEYLQICFHVILTDSEEIASHAFNTLKKYLSIYERVCLEILQKNGVNQAWANINSFNGEFNQYTNHPKITLKIVNNLVDLSEFNQEVVTYVKAFLNFVGSIPNCFANVRAQVPDAISVQKMMIQPLVPFETLATMNVIGVPLQTEGQQNVDQDGMTGNDLGQSNDPMASIIAKKDEVMQDHSSSSRVFEVYGARSLQQGGDFMSLLLSQYSQLPLIEQDPQRPQMSRQVPPKLIQLFQSAYFSVFSCFRNSNNESMNTQLNIWSLEPNNKIANDFLKCLTAMIHLFKAQLLSIDNHLDFYFQRNAPYEKMNQFFDFIICLLRNIPQYQNLVRYLVLYQFRDIVFETIFGAVYDLNDEFIRRVKGLLKGYINQFLFTFAPAQFFQMYNRNQDRNSLARQLVLLNLKQVNIPVICEFSFLTFKIWDLFQDQLEDDQILNILEILLHYIQHPLTPTHQKSRFIQYFNKILEMSQRRLQPYQSQRLPVPGQNGQRQRIVKNERINELLIESMNAVTKICKCLLTQTDQALEFFENNQNGEVKLDLTVGQQNKVTEALSNLSLQKKRSNDSQKPLAVGISDIEMGEEFKVSDIQGQMNNLQLSYKSTESETSATSLIDSVFTLKEQDVVDSYNFSFLVSWKSYSHYTFESERLIVNQPIEHYQPFDQAQFLQRKKEVLFLKMTKNIFFTFNQIQNLLTRPPAKDIYNKKVMKIYKKFVSLSCRVIQNLAELMPNDENVKNLSKLLKVILTQYTKVNQFRDLLNACSDDIFGLCVEAKVKETNFGMTYLAKSLMIFEQNEQLVQQSQYQVQEMKGKIQRDLYTANFLEAFFEYLKSKIEVFDLEYENEELNQRCALSKQDQRLCKLSFKKVQDTLQSYLQLIGEQTFKHANDNQMKHTFFAVFVFCLKQIRSGKIVPKYFNIIRTFLKDVANNQDDKEQSKEFQNDFKPMVQGLLETFLQQRDESSYVTIQTNEICCLMPTKIRNLLDHLISISEALIDSIQSHHSATGISTIQFWLVLLTQYPYLLDPIIQNIQPDLIRSLQATISHFTTISLKLIGKLGAKSRIYDLDNKLNSRNYPEDGLKITLHDKNSQHTITFGIDSVIDALFRQLSYINFNSNQIINYAGDFVKNAFLCYIDPNLDLNFIIATIVATRNQTESPSAQMFAKHGIKIPGFKFNAKDKQIFVSQMGRGCESHAFVKLIRCTIMAYKALSLTPEANKKQQDKQNKFMKWITQYFTLIYICKNGQLTKTMVDEINPLVFVDMLVELLLFIFDDSASLTSSQTKIMISYKGSAVALKCMLRFLSKLYKDTPQVFTRLEIISILVKKICNQVNELRRTLAINIAIEILIKEMPNQAVRQHSETLLNTLFLMVSQSKDSVVESIEEKVKPTIFMLIEALGIMNIKNANENNFQPFSNFNLIDAISDPNKIEQRPEIKMFVDVMDQLLNNILSTNQVTQRLSIEIIEEIARRNDVKVCHLLRSLPRYTKNEGGTQQAPMSWTRYIFDIEIQPKVKEIFEMFKGGYSQIQLLISYFNIILFYLKHEEGGQVLNKLHVFMGVADCILLLLKDECMKLDEATDSNLRINPMVYQSTSITRLARRYSKMERIYINQNKEYDPYSHTMHAHFLLNQNHFEVNQVQQEELQIEEIEKLKKAQLYLELDIFAGKLTRNQEVFRQGLVRPPDGFRQQTETYDLSDSARREFQYATEIENKKGLVKRKIDELTDVLFPQQRSVQDMKIHDVGFEYMHKLYEVYPNVKLHTELICKSIEVLYSISAHPDFVKPLLDRQNEFFRENHQQQQQQQQQQDQMRQQIQRTQEVADLTNSFLKTPLDFYMVLIKGSIIAMFFKLFQRDEKNIQKMSSKVIGKLLRVQDSSFEAFPGPLLRTCVKTIMSSISFSQTRQPFQKIQHFQHLGRLIKVLHTQFNPNLGNTILTNTKHIIERVMSPYLFRYLQHDAQRRGLYPVGNLQRPNAQADQFADPNAIGQQPAAARNEQTETTTEDTFQQNQNNPAQQQDQPDAQALTPEEIKKEIEHLIEQYNIKVHQINIAVGTINLLHLLHYQRIDTNEEVGFRQTILQALSFQNYLIHDFKDSFMLIFDDLLKRFPQNQLDDIKEINRLRQFYSDQLNPIGCQIGFLKSNILEGIEKYYNKHAHEVQNLLRSSKYPELRKLLTELLHRKQNFCIRQKLQLDILLMDYKSEIHRLQQDRQQESSQIQHLINLIDQVYSYSKFYPQCLKYQNSTEILDILRERWLNKESGGFSMTQAKEVFTKILKILVIYCKNDDADAQILFDLLKDFHCSIELDLQPLVTLCTIDIPQKAPLKRKISIMDTALSKIITSQSHYVAKYYMFEFAFMPLALSCASDKAKFNSLFTRYLIGKFINTFFENQTEIGPNGVIVTSCVWRRIQENIEKKQLIDYQNFFIEIIKVLIIILRHVDSFEQFKESTFNKDGAVIQIIDFLAYCIKAATDLHLKSFAFYAISCLCLKYLNLPIDYTGNQDDNILAMQGHMRSLPRELLLQIEKSVRDPLFELQLDQIYDKNFLSVTQRMRNLYFEKGQRQMKQYKAVHLDEKINSQHFQIHDQTLIQNTFINIQRIFNYEQLLKKQKMQTLDDEKAHDFWWKPFKLQYSFRPNLHSRIALCSLISNTPTQLIFNLGNRESDEESLLRRIEKTFNQFIYNFLESESDKRCTHSARMQQCMDILKLIRTYVDWRKKINQEKQNLEQNDYRMYQDEGSHQMSALDSQNQKKSIEILSAIIKLFYSQLKPLSPFFCQSFSTMDSSIQNQQIRNEFYQFVNECFRLVKDIFMSIKIKVLNGWTDQMCPRFDLPEKLILKSTFNLNLQVICLKYGEQTPQNRRILLDFLQNTNISRHEIEQYPDYFNKKQLTPLIKRNFKPQSSFEGIQSSMDDKDQSGNENGGSSLDQIPLDLNRTDIPQPDHIFSEQIYQVNMILHPIHVIILAIKQSKGQMRQMTNNNLEVYKQRRFDSSSQAAHGDLEYLKPFLRQAMWYDVRKSLDRDFVALQKQLFHNFQREMHNNQPTHNNILIKVIANTMGDELFKVQQCLPHFSIRLISKLEKLRDEGILTEEELESWVDKDLYTEICNAVTRVVTQFKQIICQEKVLQSKMCGNSSSQSAAQQDGIDFETRSSKPDPFWTQTYEDFEFEDDCAQFELKKINQDIWTKESIMIAVKSIVHRLKFKETRQEVFTLTLDQIKMIFRSFQFHNWKTCDFLLGKMYEIVKFLVEDQPEQQIKVAQTEITHYLLQRLVSLTRPREAIGNRQDPNSLLNRICELCLDFLERQQNILQNEKLLNLFDKVIQLNQSCSFELGQRQFRIFEKFFGSSLKAKLNYFFNKLALDNNAELYQNYASLKFLLQFSLYNFNNSSVKLQKVKNSTNLCPLSNPLVVFDNTQILDQNEQGIQIMQSLQPFYTKYQKYRNHTVKDLMKPLLEIIRINPEHTPQDKNVAEKIFSKVFWQYWHILDRPDQQYFGEIFNKIFQNFIRFTSWLQQNPAYRQQFARTLLEQVVSLREPQVRIEPEILQYMGKHYNLWHIAIPQLENHTLLYSKNERYFHALQELYSGLMEEDFSAGLSRIVTKSPEMRTMYTFSQHHNWEQLKTLFSQYINYYAEQEGLLKYLENAQEIPGKYSRQMARNTMIEMIQPNSMMNSGQEQQRPQAYAYTTVFEQNEAVKQTLDSRQFPRPGGNRKISDIDLRQWENLFLKSLKILKFDNLYQDVAENLNRFENTIEFLWEKKDRKLLDKLERILFGTQQGNAYHVPPSSIQRVRYHMYYFYILGNQIDTASFTQQFSGIQATDQSIANEMIQQKAKFNDNYAETGNLAVQQLKDNLPGYVDTIQNEYYILAQQICEAQEGIGNVIMDLDRKSVSDLRIQMNIWREKLPHKCESIQTWQELLQNRNYIFLKLGSKIQSQKTRQSQMAAGQGEQSQQASIDHFSMLSQRMQRNSPISFSGSTYDCIDLVWNNLKLAEVSRKHELPFLASTYLSEVTYVLEKINPRGEILKFERFKYAYENFKLQVKFKNQNSGETYELLKRTLNETKNEDYQPWMQAELMRIVGEHYLKQGQLVPSMQNLLKSIEKNRRESKTWFAYAKLNELIFMQQKEDMSAENALKGYFSAMTLSQHKARFIVPHIFKLLTHKKLYRDNTQQQTQTQQPSHPQAPGTIQAPTQPPPEQQRQKLSDIEFIISKNILHNIPIWLWLFWLPQLIQYQLLPQTDALHNISKLILYRLSPAYPQVVWYPLKAIKRHSQFLLRELLIESIKQTQVAPRRLYHSQPIKFFYSESHICQYIHEFRNRFRSVVQSGGQFNALQETQNFVYGRRGRDAEPLRTLQNTIWDSNLQKVQQALTKRHKKLVQNLQKVVTELQNIAQQTKQEYLIRTFKELSLNFSLQLEFKKNMQVEWGIFVKNIHRKLELNVDQSTDSFIEQEWQRLLIDEQTSEKSLLEKIKIVKNFRDYLLMECNMRDQDIQLQDVSPFLHSFPQKGIELPAQHIIDESEPRPEKVLLIDKMIPTFQRSGQREKKFTFRCTNQKCYSFTATSYEERNFKEYAKMLSQERVIQLQVVMNMTLKRHKESARRGVKFYTSPFVLIPNNKLALEDKSFGDFQETHDYLLQERGLDPDMALLLQVQHVQDIYDKMPENTPKDLSMIKDWQIQEMNKACYQEMRQEVKSNLLSSYFHRIFLNVDNMFIFKKQFIKQHAINSFFSYVFNQTNQQDLSSLQFCKATGRINFSNASLRHVLATQLPPNSDYFAAQQPNANSDNNVVDENNNNAMMVTDEGGAAVLGKTYSKGEMSSSISGPACSQYGLGQQAIQQFEDAEAEVFKLMPKKSSQNDLQQNESEKQGTTYQNGQYGGQESGDQTSVKIDQYLPFRITPNIEEFMGAIGIQGLFAGVITASSLAISSQRQRTQVLLEILLGEEIKVAQSPQQPQGSVEDQQRFEEEVKRRHEDETRKYADFCMFKIASLSNHSKIIEQPPKSEESKQPPISDSQKDQLPAGIKYDSQTDCFLFGPQAPYYKVPREYLDLEMDRPNIPEEYNKKVFALIEMATDDKRRAQKQINWCAWF